MVCKYYFLVEWFQTLSKACYDCPNNMSDCSRNQCILANGVERVVMVVNRQLPGPLIQVCLEDTINVVLMNNLRMGETASIHWHGLYHKDSIWMDGVGMITQCPINPMTTFEYK
jgi:L-ascorbate oxidase